MLPNDRHDLIIPTPGPSRITIRRSTDEHGEIIAARLDSPGLDPHGFPYLTMKAIDMPGGGTEMRVGWNDGGEARKPDEFVIQMCPDGSPRLLINMANSGEPARYAATTIEGIRKIARNPTP